MKNFLSRRLKNNKTLTKWPNLETFFSFEEIVCFPFIEDEGGRGFFGFGHQNKGFFAGKANQYLLLNTYSPFPSIEEMFTEQHVTYTWGVLYKKKDQELDEVGFKYGEQWERVEQELATQEFLFSESFPMTVIVRA